jgi:hypothetical protein
MKTLFALLVMCLLLFPQTVTFGAGLVPCDPSVGPDGKIVDACGFCDFGQLIYNVMNALTAILGMALVLMMIVSGVYLAASVGNSAAKTAVKRVLSLAIVGYIIMLTAWTITDVFLKVFLTEGNEVGIWNDLTCE